MRWLRLLAIALACAALAVAHVGSPDVYLDSQAGPYKLFVTIRPPNVIPGVAEIEVRSETPGISHMRSRPVADVGPGSEVRARRR